MSTRRTAWAKVEPKYNQISDETEKNNEPEKENFTYTPKVNEISRDMMSARMYTNRDVTDRLTSHAKRSPVKKSKPQRDRTIIDITSFLAGPAEIEECLKASTRDDVGKHRIPVSCQCTFPPSLFFFPPVMMCVCAYGWLDVPLEVEDTEAARTDFTLLEEAEHSRPVLSAKEREKREEQFKQFLTRQHAAQERKKIQVIEVSIDDTLMIADDV